MNSKILKAKANHIRNEIIQVAVANGAGHIAPSLSCVDILTVLYYECMKYDTENPLWEDRDRLVFSKAHGCYGLYAILADMGILPEKEWKSFYTKDSALPGCMERKPEYGFETGCGSLGHGLPIAVGIAFGAKTRKKDYHVFCVVGDGELQEGVTWEALQFAVKHEVNNLTVIVDFNRLQAMDFILNVLDKEEKDMIKRLEGFGLSPVICGGHDAGKLTDCIKETKKSLKNKPGVIIAETIKGYGLKCMENVPKFHFRIPTDEEMSMGKSHE